MSDSIAINEFKCSECNEVHQLTNGEQVCTTVHKPSVNSQYLDPNTKLCQSCIERGFKPPNVATREWQQGAFYCDDCFTAIINNLSNVAPAQVDIVLSNVDIPSNGRMKGPLLDLIYQYFNIPPELQFDKLDLVHKNHEKFFVHAQNSVLNKSLEELAKEKEEFEAAAFIIRYEAEPHTLRINKLKEERRKEKNLTGLQDSKEQYAKLPKGTSKTKEKEMEKLARAMGMTVEEAKKEFEKRRLMEFNKLSGNCPNCGEALHEGNCTLPLK